MCYNRSLVHEHDFFRLTGALRPSLFETTLDEVERGLDLVERWPENGLVHEPETSHHADELLLAEAGLAERAPAAVQLEQDDGEAGRFESRTRLKGFESFFIKTLISRLEDHN